MLKIVFLLFFCIYVSVSFSQEEAALLEEKASKAYHYGENPKEALEIYKVLHEKFPDYEPSITLGHIGSLYFRMGNYDEAETFYLKALTQKGRIKRAICHDLTKIYLQQKNYKRALQYLKLAEKKYPNRKTCSKGERSRQIELNYLYAQCYVGMNQSKKALNQLTPFVFYLKENIAIDSLKHNEITQFYINELLQEYSDKRIKKEFNKISKNISCTNKPCRSDKYSEKNWNDINVHFTFFGNRVQLVSFSYRQGSWSEKTIAEYTKKNILQSLEHTPVWKRFQPDVP